MAACSYSTWRAKHGTRNLRSISIIISLSCLKKYCHQLPNTQGKVASAMTAFAIPLLDKAQYTLIHSELFGRNQKEYFNLICI